MFFGNRERYPQPRILRTVPKRTSYTFRGEGGREVTVFRLLPPTIPASFVDTGIYRPIDLLLRDVRFIRDRYGIEVKFGRRDNNDIDEARLVSCGSLAAAESAVILREELAKYPYGYLQGCQINRIRFVEELAIPKDGQPNKLQTIGGKAYYYSGHLYVKHHSADIRVREGIHHELGHRSDQVIYQRLRSYGQLGAWLGWFHRKPWPVANSQGVYLDGKYFDLPPEEISALDITGFARAYGRNNYWEDRATVAEGLMTDPKGYFDRGKSDPILNRKIQLMMADFWLRSGGLMTKGYFEDLAADKVNETYWDSKIENSGLPLHKVVRPSAIVAAGILVSLSIAYLNSRNKIRK